MSITRGKWKVTNDGLHIYSEDTELDIATCPITTTRTPDRKEAEANANLIAAAPELLEAAVELRDHLKSCDQEIWLNNRAGEMLLKAITKAEG